MEKERALYSEWVQALKGSPEYEEELKSIENNPGEIEDRFYKELTFGTAGLRGFMALGTNRMNIFTVGKATQGLADYLLSQNNNPSVAIAYDSRNNSKTFSEHAASVFAANGIKVYLHPTLVPTPVLAYTTKTLGCDCGVMVTASHNPKEYNGYKVFDSNGCQIGSDVAGAVFTAIQKVDIFAGVKTINFKDALDKKQVSYAEDKIKEDFLDTVFAEALQPEVCKKAELSMVYTPLNGTGNLFVREILKRLEVGSVSIVKEQEMPDGNFPTCPYPNPEFPEALEYAISLAKEKEVDFVLATDPDADRANVAVRHNGEYEMMTGNKLGVLLLDYIAKTRIKLGTMPKNPVTVRSIVSTKLTDKVAAEYGVEVRDVLTGFKYLGEVIGKLAETNEENRFIFGFEEAIGFLIGTHVRDKDAIVASTLLTEMIAYYKLEGKTLVDVLEEIYEKHGYYSNMAQNLVFPGAEGMDKMTGIMSELRNNPPEEIVGRKIVTYLDYKTSVKVENGVESKLDFESSNVLEYRLEDGCGIIIRPSGTEPKLKLYYSLIGKSYEEVANLEKEFAPASVELAGVEA